jgi:S-(hydroxymethyl)glutathione synthase
MSSSLHPLLDNGIKKGDSKKSGGKIHCHCKGSDRVEVQLGANTQFNHACGCSKCWKPDGALFSIIGVIPQDKLSVTANEKKLKVVDPKAGIQRHACKDCGVHLYGRIEADHAFKGLDFVHTELSDESGWEEPGFAAFVSSIIEQGFDPDKMSDVRKKLNGLGLETYDCLSPALMDLLAAHAAKKQGTFKTK